jgi:ATP-dependent DNA helicase RecG
VNDAELADLITGPETERVERKQSMSDADKIREAICAFANDLPASGLPGVVAVGVDDGGSPGSLAITDRLLQQLSFMRDDGNIVPFPSMEVRRLAIHGADVAVAIVQPHSSPPVAFRGRVWIRVGPRRAIATPDEERMLIERRRLANLPFDSRPLASAGVGDLVLETFRTEILPQLVDHDVLADNHRPVEQQLAALRLIDPEGHATPTGLLVCGVEPEAHLPGAYLQFNRFDGTELVDPIVSTHRLSGPLPQIMREVDEVVRANVGTRVVFAGEEREQRRSDAPFDAIQQLVRNALIHRVYEGTNAPVRISWFRDRVEIHSPGGPYGQVTIETFGRPGVTDYRNPSLAGVLGQLGYVQRFGLGIAVARSALDKNGNPSLELVPTLTHVLAIVRFE